MGKCIGNPMLSVSADSDRVTRTERLGTHKSLLQLSALSIQCVVQWFHVNFHTVCLLGSSSLWLIELSHLRLYDGQEMILRKTKTRMKSKHDASGQKLICGTRWSRGREEQNENSSSDYGESPCKFWDSDRRSSLIDAQMEW